MPASLQRRTAQCLAVGLLALTVALSVTAPAEGWRRPSDYAISSPDGGDYRVCRDGIRFEVASRQSLPANPPLTQLFNFRVFSPPPIDAVTGLPTYDQGGNLVGTTVAQGTATALLQPPPGYDAGGTLYWYQRTHTQRSSGGQLLEPGPDAVYFEAFFADPNAPVALDRIDDVADCLLFPPKPFCREGVTSRFPKTRLSQAMSWSVSPPPPHSRRDRLPRRQDDRRP